MKPVVLLVAIFCYFTAKAQDIPFDQQKSILFPHPMNRNWQVSLGFTTTTMPHEITEEVHFRVPAGDVHAIRKLNEHFYLDGELNLQVLQNRVSIGPRWAKALNDRVSISAGNDVAFWFGSINTEGINTKGSGWQNHPNISFGYRFNKRILVSLKAESLMNFGIKTYAGDIEVTSKYRLFSGSAYTIAIEQPFYKQKSLTLGFKAIYSNYYWQTWTLFESFDRNIFFPQVIVGLIL